MSRGELFSSLFSNTVHKAGIYNLRVGSTFPIFVSARVLRGFAFVYVLADIWMQPFDGAALSFMWIELRVFLP